MTGERLTSLDPQTGDRPLSRIGHAGNARQLVQRLKYEDQTRMHRYTKIMGLLDGNPPWPSKKLVDVGQGHRANFNLREGEGIVEAAKTPYYDLIFEVPQFARIFFHSEGIEPHLCSTWNNVISEEYSETLSDWIGFDQNIQLHQYQMIVHGVGPIFWPHGIAWRSEATKARKVLVPQETKANVEDLELVAVLHSYRADELESYIAGADPDTEDYHGWNVPFVRDAIIDCAQRDMRQQYGIENYDLYQRAIRTGDLFYGITRSSRVFVASLFVREFGGKVSHYMITDSASGKGGSNETYNGLEEEQGYLYKKRRKYKDFTQVICPFFFDVGPDGTWHAVKGLGPKIFDFCDVSNRTFCQMLDGAVIGSGITLEAQEGASLEETQIALVGGATVVQPGYKVVQTRIAESLNGAMSMRRELQNVLQSNTGQYRQRVAEEEQEPTLGQAQINQQIQAQLSKGATNRYCNNFNKFHTETLRRMMDPSQNQRVPGGLEAVEFVARCIMRGVPPEMMQFRNIQKVRASRSIGYGSPQMRDMATRELVGMIPMMDEVSRNHALRARAAALPGVGQASVDEFFPPIEQQGVPNVHTSYATTENNALRTRNGRALVEPGQNHSIHFDTHFKDTQEHYQDPQADPSEKLIHMEQSGGHMAQHLKLLEGDPSRKQEVKQKQGQLDGLAKATDQLQQQIQEAAQAAQAEQQEAAPDPNAQAKVAKMTGELTLKAQKMKGEMALKAQKQQFQQTILDKKTAADIKRANAKTSIELGQKKAAAQQDMTHKAAKTKQDMDISAMQASEPTEPTE